jgi:N utilization substance protein B
LGSRRSARIIALQALYQIDICEKSVDDILGFDWVEKDVDIQTLDFARMLIEGSMQYKEIIDSAIAKQLEHWDLDRLSFIDRAILRFSTYSLYYQADVPDTVVINEAIDLAKQFGSDDSYRFVNGVLDGIRKGKINKGSPSE